MAKRFIPFFEIIILLLAACKPQTRYVPTEHTTLRTDTLWRTLMQRDSVRVTDSVIILIKGDTLLIREKTRETRTREVRDTIREVSIERDTVPVIVETERKLTRWQRTKQDWGGRAIATCALLLAATIFAAARKR